MIEPWYYKINQFFRRIISDLFHHHYGCCDDVVMNCHLCRGETTPEYKLFQERQQTKPESTCLEIYSEKHTESFKYSQFLDYSECLRTLNYYLYSLDSARIIDHTAKLVYNIYIVNGEIVRKVDAMMI